MMYAPLAIPPASKGEEWKPFIQSALETKMSGRVNPATAKYLQILLAYSSGEAKEFNKAVASYRKWLDDELPDAVGKADFETSFNNFAPFYWCGWLYVAVFILGCCGWLGWSQPLMRASFWLAMVTLVVHTAALAARMYLLNRPFVFVTNLYSSAVFIGWGCVISGLVLEAIYHNGIGNVVAAACGSLTLLIAHHLALSGDTLEMMQAVLDTNFWLATHVTCVTIGYVATFVAGFLGILFILRGVLTPSLDRDALKTLGQMIYGVVCFATLFSFTGTVLGGIWADQSWGRFWGWDPKENGALLIVLWNALILHARWGGMVKQRGMAVLAVVGNMVTGWSWFGTNQLGVGLHAYGFNNTLAFGLVVFWCINLAIIAAGLLPVKYWCSFGNKNRDSFLTRTDISARGRRDLSAGAASK
jgi:ABC-type transport system involved in cytochrome c biogenesis permease subunit